MVTGCKAMKLAIEKAKKVVISERQAITQILQTLFDMHPKS